MVEDADCDDGDAEDDPLGRYGPLDGAHLINVTGDGADDAECSCVHYRKWAVCKHQHAVLHRLGRSSRTPTPS